MNLPKTEETLKMLLALGTDEEVVVDGERWWRHRRSEFKVSPYCEIDPDLHCRWICACREDIAHDLGLIKE